MVCCCLKERKSKKWHNRMILMPFVKKVTVDFITWENEL